MARLIASLLLVLHSTLALAGVWTAMKDPSAGFNITFTMQEDDQDRGSKDPRSSDQEGQESGESDSDFCHRHALRPLLHTREGLSNPSICHDVPAYGNAVSRDIHKPPPNSLT